MKKLMAKVVSNPLDSVIDYKCPKCGKVHSLEPDAGTVKCSCGVLLECDVMSCLDNLEILLG